MRATRRNSTGVTVTSLPRQFDVQPPDQLYDLDAMEVARNAAYCRELEAAMLEFETNPRNFFRLKHAKRI